MKIRIAYATLHSASLATAASSNTEQELDTQEHVSLSSPLHVSFSRDQVAAALRIAQQEGVATLVSSTGSSHAEVTADAETLKAVWQRLENGSAFISCVVHVERITELEAVGGFNVTSGDHCMYGKQKPD